MVLWVARGKRRFQGGDEKGLQETYLQQSQFSLLPNPEGTDGIGWSSVSGAMKSLGEDYIHVTWREASFKFSLMRVLKLSGLLHREP